MCHGPRLSFCFRRKRRGSQETCRELVSSQKLARCLHMVATGHALDAPWTPQQCTIANEALPPGEGLPIVAATGATRIF